MFLEKRIFNLFDKRRSVSTVGGAAFVQGSLMPKNSHFSDDLGDSQPSETALLMLTT
jgi:hypothetical protein